MAFLFHNLHEDGTCTEAEEAVRQACWIVQEHTTGSQVQETETFWEAAGDFSVEPNTGGPEGPFWDRTPYLPVVGKLCLMQGTPCPDKAVDMPRKARSARASATVHRVRYGGCSAPHCQRRGTLPPTPRQQGGEGREARTGRPRGSLLPSVQV